MDRLGEHTKGGDNRDSVPCDCSEFKTLFIPIYVDPYFGCMLTL